MYTQTDLSKITCFADDNVAESINSVLQTLEIPKVYIQRAKQTMLVDHSRFLRLRSYTTAEETRAMLYRFHVPKKYETGVMRRIAEAADLYLPGRGSIYARDVTLLRKSRLTFNEAALAEVCGEEQPAPDNYDALVCIVHRGMAAALARDILEMGLSVPLISFANGMGGRDQMGLLRITIPVEKEMLFFLIPRIDAEFLKGIITRKARLDLPGHGFLYQFHTRALAVNLRVRRGNRTSAATMEQVINALDQLRGSSEWRRLGVLSAKAAKEAKNNEKERLGCFSFIMDEGQLAPYVKTALSAGAGGATRIPLIFQSYAPQDKNTIASGARELCDLIMPKAVSEPLLKDIRQSGFFERSDAGMIELTSVHDAVTYTGREKKRPAFLSRIRKNKN